VRKTICGTQRFELSTKLLTRLHLLCVIVAWVESNASKGKPSVKTHLTTMSPRLWSGRFANDEGQWRENHAPPHSYFTTLAVPYHKQITGVESNPPRARPFLLTRFSVVPESRIAASEPKCDTTGINDTRYWDKHTH
jgi:hypothetical protein